VQFAANQALGIAGAAKWRATLSPEKRRGHVAKCIIASAQYAAYRHGHLPPRFSEVQVRKDKKGRWVRVPGSEREIFPPNPWRDLPPHPLGVEEQKQKALKLLAKWRKRGIVVRLTTATGELPGWLGEAGGGGDAPKPTRGFSGAESRLKGRLKRRRDRPAPPSSSS
jgi:hypothetical protein